MPLLENNANKLQNKQFFNNGKNKKSPNLLPPRNTGSFLEFQQV